MKYDALFVGAGITAATICSQMKDKWRILVLDTRNYIGGNCHDYKLGNNYVQSHGPHNWHCPNPEITKFVSQYTEWTDFEYTVTAEIKMGHEYARVPFPYSQQTEKIIGKLNEEQITDYFFKGYSEKMWGMPWDQIPRAIPARVPKNTAEKSVFFPGHWQAQPKLGYTHMIENMFDGVEIMLNVDPNMWKEIPAHRIYYCGRPDILVDGPKLQFRTLKISWKHENWDADTVSVNFCHKEKKYMRKVNYGMYYHNKNCKTISYETPLQASDDDLVPYYPIATDENLHNYQTIKTLVSQQYPNLYLLGRVAGYKYIDMHQTIGIGLSIVKNEKQASVQTS